MIGVEKGYYQFTSHLIAELIRVVSKGSAPGNNLLMDILYNIVAIVSLPHSIPHPSHYEFFTWARLSNNPYHLSYNSLLDPPELLLKA
jgi:hypothetical protein